MKKEKVACQNASQIVKDHFVDVNKMVHTGSGSSREQGVRLDNHNNFITYLTSKLQDYRHYHAWHQLALKINCLSMPFFIANVSEFE